MKLKKQNKWSPVIAACGTLALSAGLAHSAILINLSPTDTGASVTIVGSLSVSTLTPVNVGAAAAGTATVDFNTALFGNPAIGIVDVYEGALVGAIGAGSGLPLGVSPAEDTFNGFGVTDFFAVVPSGYAGESVDFSASYVGSFFPNTGGTVSLGDTLTVTLPNDDFITITTSDSAVPEPSSIVLLSALLGAGFLRRKR